MRGHWYKTTVMLTMLLMLAGCGGDGAEAEQTVQTEQVEQTEQTLEQVLEEHFLAAEDAEDVATVVSQYAEETPDPALAEFLISYYQVPDEEQSKTRYYYNHIDLNEDGTDEIFVVVVGEYTKVSFGDPALILSEQADGTFQVIESFEGIHTPVTVSERMTNGWHDIIYQEYGRGAENGYRICHYNPNGGYQTDLSEVVDEVEPQDGTQIISNNFIDDMDKGNYMTLAPEEDGGSEAQGN